MGAIRKEREEKGLGRGGQTIENYVNMRNTEFSQSPHGHFRASR